MADADLAARIERLESIEEIKALKHRYFRAMTDGDYDLLRDVLTEDVVTSYSDGEYVFDDREALLRFLVESHTADRKVIAYWMCAMPEIELQGPDEATGIWAFYHQFFMPEQHHVDEMFAYYDDRYRREDGVWRIAYTGYRRIVNQEIDRRDVAYKLKAPPWAVTAPPA